MKYWMIRLTAAAACLLVAFGLGTAAGEKRARQANASYTGERVDVTQSSSLEQSIQNTAGTKPDDTTQPTQNYTTQPVVIEGMPGTTAEIVAYFNDAVNKIKLEKAAVTQTQDRITVLQAGFGKNDLRSVLQDLNRDDRTRQRIASDLFPARGEVWASRLLPDGVEQASCTEDNGIFRIELHLKSEKSDPGRKDGIYQSCMTVPPDFDLNQIDMLGAKCSDFQLTYNRAFIICEIDSKTQQPRSAQYYLHVDASANVTLGGMLRRDCVAELELESKYEIAWN